MFSQASVCPQGGQAWSWGGGVPAPRGVSALGGGVYSQGGVYSPGVSASGGCLLWGVSAPGVSAWGVCLVWGVSAPGGVCTGRVPGLGGGWYPSMH